jgi:hypothetical protein
MQTLLRTMAIHPTSVAARIAVTTLLLGYDAGVASPQALSSAYPNMLPLVQYQSPSREDEIALARSAAPPAIANDAEVRVFGPKGYETAVKGTNGFVCLVVRSWDKNFDSPDFWNPKIRSPQCFNKPAARSVLPAYLRRTEWVLAGVSSIEMSARTKSAVAAHEIGAVDIGSMVYMMSKRGYLGDDAGGPWRPHVMFLLPRTLGSEWGADVQGSPIFSDSSRPEPITVFVVPVGRWSDGTVRSDAPARSDGTPPQASTHNH